MRSRWWHEPLILLLALWAFAAIAPDFALVFGDLPKLGVVADNDGNIIRASGRAKEQLKGCTTIDLEQTDFPNRLALFGGMAGMQYVREGVEVSLSAWCRDPNTPQPKLKSISLTPEIEKTPLHNRLLLLLQQVIGVLFILIGTLLVLRRRSAASWGFFLFSIWFNPGQNFVLYAELQRWPAALLAQEVIQAVLQAAGYFGLVIFALTFPKDAPEQRRRGFERRAYQLGGIAAVLQLALQLWSFATAFGFGTELPTRISFLVGYGIEILVIVILARKFLASSGQEKAKLKWVFAGSLIGLPAYILADMSASTSVLARWWEPPDELISVLYLANGLLLYAVFTAVWRKHVIDVKYILGRRLILISTWILISAVLVVAIAVPLEAILEHYLRDEGTSDTVIKITRYAVYVASLVALKIIMDWGIERANEKLDALVFRERHKAQKRLRDLIECFEKNLGGETWVHQQLVHTAAEQLSLMWAAIFRIHPDGTLRREHAYHQKEEDSEVAEFTSPSELLVKYLAEHSTSKRIADLPDMIEPAADGVDLPSLAIPITVDGRLSWILFYGFHTGGDDIDKSERELLVDLAHAGTRAYHRIELGRLRDTITKLEREVHRLSADNEEFKNKLAASERQIAQLRSAAEPPAGP